MKPDIYYVYRRHDDGHKGLVGKFIVTTNGFVKILEDHDHLAEMVPEGQTADQVGRRIAAMVYSPYWSVVRDSDVEAGHNADDIEELNLGIV